MQVLIAFVLALTAVAAVPRNSQRIVGGSETSINENPDMVALLYSWSGSGHRHVCGGIILNNRAILTAAHCPYGDSPVQWAIRAGSSTANSGGVLHHTSRINAHINYNRITLDSDLATLHTTTVIRFTVVIQPAFIAGSSYLVRDNEIVWAAGWGSLIHGGPLSERLRQVQVWTINQAICRNQYAHIGLTVTDNMLCSGWLNVGGRDQCQGDSGGPLYHHRIVIGVCSWGFGCGQSQFPGVNVRVSRFTAWIQANA